MRHLANEHSIITPYRRHEEGCQPPAPYQAYEYTIKRSPSKPLTFLPHTLSEITGPIYGHGQIAETDNDLTRQHAGEPNAGQPETRTFFGATVRYANAAGAERVVSIVGTDEV